MKILAKLITVLLFFATANSFGQGAAGPDQYICLSTSATMAAIGLGAWSALPSNPAATIISNSSDSATSISGFTSTGIYGFIWTTFAGSDTVAITVSGVTAYAGPDQYVCRGGTVMLGGAPTASSGSGDYRYAWSPGVALSSTTNSNPQATPVVTTTYTVTVTDNISSCSATDAVLVTVSASVTVTVSPDTNIMSGHQVFMTATGHPAGGTYQWAPLVSITPAAGNSAVEIAAPASTQTYQVIYTVNGCYDTAYETIHVYSVYAGPDQTICQYTTTILAASGSGGWSNAVWSIGPLTIANRQDPHSLVTGFTQSGTYGLIWTDSMSHITDTVVISVIAKPNAGTDQVICQNTTATMAATGAGIWSPLSINPSPTLITTPSSATTVISGFTVAGSYGFVWTIGGCTDTLLVQVAPSPVVRDSIVNTSCSGSVSGSICALASGGVGPYTYSWTTGNTTPCINISVSGIYQVYVTGGNGCYTTDTSIIISSSPITVTQTHVDVLCHAGSTGSITLTATGGVAPYTYTWTGGLTGPHNTNLSAGTYCITVTDINNCSATVCSPVSEPSSAFSVMESHVDVNCGGAATGSITLTSSGGTTPYGVVSWGGGTTGYARTALIAGTYSYTVNDADNCLVSGFITLGQRSSITATDSVHNVSCAALDGAICIHAANGIAPYSYLWSTGDVTSCISNMAAGNYNVTITDSLGCQLTKNETIFQPSPVTISHSNVDVSCHGGADGSLTVVASGGTPTYTYMWSGGFLSPVPAQSGLTAGTYCVTVQDANLCSAVDCITITEPAAISVSVDSVHDASCLGTYDGDIFITATGGIVPYSYMWASSPVAITEDLLAAPAGTYSLQVTDANGCTFPYSASILIGHDCIWPGDADNNLLVDNNDLLPIGLAYDTTGPQRIAASIVWVGQTCQNWSDTFATGVNYKYADCNGDGIVNADDTLAITQNFGLIHSKTNGNNAPWRSGQPVIYPMVSRDTVTNGDTVLITINLGQLTLAATNVYGIAFSLNYDPLVVDTSRTTMSFTNSWLGGPADAIHLYKDIKSQGVIKAAITRIDHTARTGQGQIAYVRAIVTTDNIDGKDLSYYSFHCNISDVTAVDAAGHIIALNEGADSNQVAFTPLGVSDINVVSAQISVYPNPTNKVVIISSAKAHVAAIDLQNVLGKTLSSYTYADHKDEHMLDMQGLSSGVYYLSIKTKAGTITKKVILSY